MSFIINENVIVSDIDGVLLDFDGGYRLVSEDLLKRPIQKICNSYSLRVRYGLTSEEANLVWKAMPHHELGWSNLPLLPGAAEAIHRLQQHGKTIFAVTGIDPKLENARIDNLSKYNIQLAGMTCVGFGNSSKLEPIRRLSPLMYFEDRLRLLNESSQVPYRVWVDHGDEQDGLEATPDIIRTSKLLDWVEGWEKKLGLHASPKPALVKPFKL